MQAIADELHQISDKLGESIYKSTITAMEKQEELKDTVSEKQEVLKDTLNEKQEELKSAISEKQVELRSVLSEKQEAIKDNVTEKQEAISGTLSDVSDEVKERIALLRKNYLENVNATSHMQKRIMKAFPKMQSRNYRESFEDLRNRLKEMSLKK